MLGRDEILGGGVGPPQPGMNIPQSNWEAELGLLDGVLEEGLDDNFENELWLASNNGLTAGWSECSHLPVSSKIETVRPVL